MPVGKKMRIKILSLALKLHFMIIIRSVEVFIHLLLFPIERIEVLVT